MAPRRGRCTNFGNCELADSNQAVELADGQELVCPKCGHQLADMGQRRGGSAMTPILATAAVLALAALAVFAFVKLRGGGASSEPTAVAPRAAPSPGNAPAPTVILRLHGSNTIGAKLVPDLAVAFLRQQGAADVKVTPGAPEEVSIQATLAGEPGPRSIEVTAHGSSHAFTDLAAGKCDIGMASRRVKPEEVTALSALGDMTSGAAEHVLGLDGVAVIVNGSNKLSALTKEQIARIFAGEITDWRQVQGVPGPITLLRRDDMSGTTDTFKSTVMGGRAFAAGATAFEDSKQLAQKVAADASSIGYVGLPYVEGARAVAVGEAGAKSLLPTRLTVATEDYALSRRLYLYTATNPSPVARKFVEFALSRAGQDIVAEAGFVSQNVAAVQAPAPAGGSSEYQRLAATAERLSLNFRFRTGSSQLDNKATVDLDRVVGFISDLRYTGNVMLFGFADARGGRELNVRLSKERANVVSAQFEQRGLRPAVVTGFGADLPVASNETEEGRERNRRVEIWVKRK